jgi:hypothetical protein
MANENPSWGEERIANELLVKQDIQVSPRTVNKYLPRHCRVGREVICAARPSCACTPKGS